MEFSVALLFAGLDRFWGAGFKRGSFIDRNHHKLSTLFTLLTCIPLVLFGGPWAIMFAIAWFGYRSIDFKHFGGRLDPETKEQLWGSFLRFLTPLPVFVAYAFIMHKDVAYIGLLFIMAALANTAVSRAYTEVAWARPYNTIDWNIVAELLHGFIYGIVVWYSIQH